MNFADLLPVGKYAVDAEMSGFKKVRITGILLQVNQTVRADLNLQVGELTDTVHVESQIELVKTDRSDVGTEIETRKMLELPLNGRNFMQLATLAPGTMGISKADAAQAAAYGGIIANGASTNANEITLDGVENQEALVNRVGIRPSPDAIEEFKLMTASYSAEYGRAAGANINVVTKGGTNNFHGSAFWFLRNDNLDSRNFFDPVGKKLPEFKQNQFGATLGGPIRKDKTFFFFSYEGIRIMSGLTVAAILPTDAQRLGDLSTGFKIYDPLTTRKDPTTGKIIRDPFQGNVILPNRISAPSQKVMDLLIPRAQQQIPNQINTILNPSQIENQNQYIVRVDQHIDNNSTLWGRFAYNNAPRYLPTFRSSGFPGQGVFFSFYQKNLVLAYNRTFSPTVVNDLRVGFNRWVQSHLPETRDKDYVSELGITGAPVDPAAWGYPTIAITGMQAVGTAFNAPSVPITNSFEYSDTLALVRGRHSLKIGADVKRTQLNGYQYATARGSFSFGGALTQNPAAPTGTGQGFADFLLGFPLSTSISIGRADNDLRSLNAGIFVQDDWDLHKNVTVNLGLRYEFMPLPVSAADRFVSWDEKDQAIVLAQNNLDKPSSAPGAAGRTVGDTLKDFAGLFKFLTRDQAGYPKSLVKTDKNNFAPRVGIAWRVFGNNATVLRGGFGIFYEIMGQNIQWNLSNQAPYSRALSFSGDPNAVPTLTLQQPFPGYGVQGKPGISGILFNWSDPYQQNWNATLQRRLSKTTSCELSYVGARGIGQISGVDWNGPVFGSGTAQSLRPHQEHGATTSSVPWGRRWYNSMQAKVESRSDTLSLLVSYTLARAITVGGGGINESLAALGGSLGWNAFGARQPVLSGRLSSDDRFLAYGKGNSISDMRHRLSAAYVWNLPFGEGRRVKLPSMTEWILGGWEFTGVTTFEAGVPFSVSANVNGDPNNGPKTVAKWFNTTVFSLPRPIAEWKAGSDPLQFSPNAGRGLVVGPGVQNWDIGLFKNFRIKENYNIEFRSEFFNAFNHPNFGQPNATFNTAAFGKIASASPARQIQFGLKLSF